MNKNKLVHWVAALALVMALTGSAAAEAGTEIARVGVSGYDLVAYHTQGQALRGSGYQTVLHDGVTYLFASEENKNAFAQNPDKYLPAYGGYCAYGVSVGKKFYASPEVWKIVDGVLYLNLDQDIQAKWDEDIPGHITTANKHWKNIEHTAPEKL